MSIRFRAAMIGSALSLAAALAQAQVPQYGANITLDQARKVAAAAEAEARKNGWPVAIAIVDNAGQMVYFQRSDNTQTASVGDRRRQSSVGRDAAALDQSDSGWGRCRRCGPASSRLAWREPDRRWDYRSRSTARSSAASVFQA